MDGYDIERGGDGCRWNLQCCNIITCLLAASVLCLLDHGPWVSLFSFVKFMLALVLLHLAVN